MDVHNMHFDHTFVDIFSLPVSGNLTIMEPY
jgi:hypothetical protein